MNFKILCVILSLLVLNVFIIINKIYNDLYSTHNIDGLVRPVYLEAFSNKPVDWRIVHTIGWILGLTSTLPKIFTLITFFTGVIVLILEFVVIFDALQCLLFPLKAYLQSSCILSSFCFASALPLYELQMSLYMPWLNDSVHCPPPPGSPFSPPWNTFPPFTSSLMPPYGSPTSIPLMNPMAGPPMSPSFFPPAPSGGFPLFCSDLGRFPPTAFMPQINTNPDTNCSYNFGVGQRPPTPRPPSPFVPQRQNCDTNNQQQGTMIIEEQA